MAPRLQQVQGCWKPTPRPLAQYDGMDFDRCPTTYQSDRAVMLVRAVIEGELKGSTQAERAAFPAKRLAALRYVEHLVNLREAAHDNGT